MLCALCDRCVQRDSFTSPKAFARRLSVTAFTSAENVARRAIDGSTRAARRAGRPHAARATKKRTSVADPKLMGSKPVTLNSSVASRRAVPAAASSPIAVPAANSVAPRRMTRRDLVAARAEREADAELARTLADAVRNPPVDADARQQQRDRREAAEQNRLQPARCQRSIDNRFERTRVIDRLLGIDRADRCRERRRERRRIAPRLDRELTAELADVAENGFLCVFCGFCG